MDDASEQYAKQIETARLAAGQGDRPTAERLLMEAIAAREGQLGAEHPSLGVALNELSRLYIRQSEFSRAEPVLERLLQITRARGESHPDVATALAGLAVAKRGLGDDAAAEQLYRRALRIREEALAPSHMAVVITLEQLSATCAARGNFAEALVHLQRALMRRESAFGADHATVHDLQARIADLQRRHAESVARAVYTPAVPAAVIEAAPAPLVTQPRRSGELVYVYQPEPVARPVLLASRATLLQPASPASRPVPVAVEAPVIADATIDFPTRRSRRRTTRFAFAGAAVVVLASAGFGYSSHAAKGSDHASVRIDAETPIIVATPVSTVKSQATVGASSGVAVVAPDSAPTSTASGALAIADAKDSQPMPASVTPSTSPSALGALPNLRRLVVPKIAMPSLDSVIRSSEKFALDADVEPIGAGGRLRTSASNEDPGVTPPMLIGPAPTPHYPDELRAQRLEGEVIVRFRVNEKGRVDPSTMQVVQSEHDLFTAAVRSALPRFRFEPAHSTARDSKPQAAWVQFRTQFTARN
ncbi:MAG: TonB family protein [Gemmatimonadaceae bacterium]